MVLVTRQHGYNLPIRLIDPVRPEVCFLLLPSPRDRLWSSAMAIGRVDPERRKALRAKALEHLEAARACMDESGDGMGNYLIERAIDEITSQQFPALDPFSEEWLTKQKPSR